MHGFYWYFMHVMCDHDEERISSKHRVAIGNIFFVHYNACGKLHCLLLLSIVFFKSVCVLGG